MPDTLPILALVRDLMFTSKVTAAAAQAGAPCRTLRDPALLADTPGRLLLVDLNLPGAIPAAAAWAQSTHQPVIGFVSHVDQPTIDAARAAGLTQILPRGQFAAQLPRLLRSEPKGNRE